MLSNLLFNHDPKLETAHKRGGDKINVIYFDLSGKTIVCRIGHCAHSLQSFAQQSKVNAEPFDLYKDCKALKEILTGMSMLKWKECVGVVTSSMEATRNICLEFNDKPVKEFPNLIQNLVSIGSINVFDPKTRSYSDKTKPPSVLARMEIRKGKIRLVNPQHHLDISISELVEMLSKMNDHQKALDIKNQNKEDIFEYLNQQNALLYRSICNRMNSLEYEGEVDVVEFARSLSDGYCSVKEILRPLADKSSPLFNVFTALEFQLKKNGNSYIVHYPDWMEKADKTYCKGSV